MLNSIVQNGLSSIAAEERLKKEGYNELPLRHKKNIITKTIHIVTEPTFLLLLTGAAIYFFLGSAIDALMLLSFVIIIFIIAFYQEHKTDNTLEKLRNLSSPRSIVIRDGIEKRIVGRELVREDIFLVIEGDRISADAILLEAGFVLIDESVLTGESLPIQKAKNDELYAGTLVIKGSGLAKVTKTGVHTKIGEIGTGLQHIPEEKSLLQRQIDKLIFIFAIFGALFCSLLLIFTKGNLVERILSSITLAMSLIPEEFPVVLSVFLALGAWRMAKQSVLTRSIPAIEALGSATVLCTDKTGTLTENQMSINKLMVEDETYTNASFLPESFHKLIEFAILASPIDPFDPIEVALKNFGKQHLENTEHLHHSWRLEQEYALSEKLLAMTHIWKSEEGTLTIASKGSPEAIFDLCHFDEKISQKWHERIDLMAKEGLRILAVARSTIKSENFPSNPHDFDFEFLGLIGFSDPLRPSIVNAVKECSNAGVKVVMITGDYPITAKMVAKEAGIAFENGCMTGSELNSIDDALLPSKIEKTTIFARTSPNQKLRLVSAFKKRGEIVAMTGDGVNDAAALKAANIGIAMGKRGTDIAREASDLVLLNDDFSSIVEAIKLGRRIFDNLQKTIFYLFAAHIPIAGIALMPLFLNTPMILLPIHVVFLELIINPACSIVFEREKEEENVMKRPPLGTSKTLLNRRNLIFSTLQGLGVLAIILFIFSVIRKEVADIEHLRTITFSLLLATNIAQIFSNLSWSRSIFKTFLTPNLALWAITIGSSAILIGGIFTPFFRQTFHFSMLHWHDLLFTLTVSILTTIWIESLKIFYKFK